MIHAMKIHRPAFDDHTCIYVKVRPSALALKRRATLKASPTTPQLSNPSHSPSFLNHPGLYHHQSRTAQAIRTEKCYSHLLDIPRNLSKRRYYGSSLHSASVCRQDLVFVALEKTKSLQLLKTKRSQAQRLARSLTNRRIFINYRY